MQGIRKTIVSIEGKYFMLPWDFTLYPEVYGEEFNIK